MGEEGLHHTLVDENGRIVFREFDGMGNHPIYAWISGVVGLVIDVPLSIDGTNTVLNRGQPGIC